MNHNQHVIQLQTSGHAACCLTQARSAVLSQHGCVSCEGEQAELDMLWATNKTGHMQQGLNRLAFRL